MNSSREPTPPPAAHSPLGALALVCGALCTLLACGTVLSAPSRGWRLALGTAVLLGLASVALAEFDRVRRTPRA